MTAPHKRRRPEQAARAQQAMSALPYRKQPPVPLMPDLRTEPSAVEESVRARAARLRETARTQLAAAAEQGPLAQLGGPYQVVRAGVDLGPADDDVTLVSHYSHYHEIRPDGTSVVGMDLPAGHPPPAREGHPGPGYEIRRPTSVPPPAWKTGR